MVGKAQTPAAPLSLPSFGGLWDIVKRRKALWALGSLLVVAALLAGTLVSSHSKAPVYETQPVVRQDLTQTVTASGTVNPQNTVNVGTQVSGIIDAIYVDYNSRVHTGEVLARLDTSQLQAQLDQAQASLAQAQAQAQGQAQNASGAQSNITGAQAGIAQAQANVAKSQSALQVAQQTVARDQALLSKGYIAQSQVDTDQSNEVAALSALQSAQAAVTQARASASSITSQAGAAQDTTLAAQSAVDAAQAQVQQVELNMQRAVITSPVNGTVIARDVSVGQTVAASLQTPTLFAIAQDLHKMEVDISVGEPDIGNVRAGDRVNFSVLAYPNQTFSGKVSQVRVNPTTVNNVVTYTVITLVNNPNDQLLPGMTANATIGVQTAKNALVVPAQALTFRPMLGAARRDKRTGSSSHTASAASPWGQTAAGASGVAASGGTGMLFVQRGGKPVPVRVRVDLVSGTQAAVTPLRGTLAAGDDVIVSDAAQQTRAPQAATPGARGPGGMGGIGRAIH